MISEQAEMFESRQRTSWRSEGKSRVKPLREWKAFEADVLALAKQYERDRVLTLRKVDPPTQVIRGKIMYTKSPFLDFMGSWTERGGKALFIEAKFTRGDRLDIESQHGVTERQMHNLRMWSASNAIAAVVWGTPAQTYFLPLSYIERTLARTNLKHLKELEVDARLMDDDWVKTMRKIFK